MKTAMNHKNRTRSISCKVKEEQYRSLQELADREARPLGEWCREVIVGAIGNRGHLSEDFAKLILEELAALRGMASSLIYDGPTYSSRGVERMKEIIVYADKAKFERAAQIISQLLKRHPDPRHE